MVRLSTLTVEFKGVSEEVLEKLVGEGYAKTKAEALRYSLLQVGRELGLITPKIHAKAEQYAYAEIKKK
ncbi:MAG: hypothetical protein WC634_05135 [archaeon]